MLAGLVLPLLEAGEPGNEHYDPEQFAIKFYTMLVERGHQTIRYDDYVAILTVTRGQCCQHSESTACDEFRCSCYVSDFLQVELQNLTHFQTICFWQGQMNTVAKLHTVFNDMASSYGMSFSVIDLYGADADKRHWAGVTVSAMRRMQGYILQKFNRNTLEKWLQSAAEWQCEQSKGAYCRLVGEHLGVELDLGEALQRMSMH